MKIKPIFKVFGVVTLLGSLAGGVYYFLFVRTRKPQVELYFDDTRVSFKNLDKTYQQEE